MIPCTFLRCGFSLCCLLFVLSLAADPVDTLYDYHSLQFYTGSADRVYLQHERYYGTFVRDTCTTPNYGTTLPSITGCWRRLHHNFSPRYWAIGGPTNDRQIGNAVRHEVDAINCAAIAAHRAGGDTVEIDALYPIDRPVFLLSGNTYLGMGDSSGWVRTDPPVTVLTDTARVGDRQLKVRNNRGFRDLQKINIVNGPGFNQVAGHISYTASIDTLLGGDTLVWLSGRPIGRQMLPGDTVSLFFPLMEIRYSEASNVRLENLVFDGNRAAYRYNYDWRVSPTLKLSTSPGNVIDGCRFYRIPVENVFLCGGRFINCSGQDLNGSAIHFSCADTLQSTQVWYNDFTRTNVVGNQLMWHSEAAATFSAKVQNFHLAYNRFLDLGELGVGIYKNDDQHNIITDNLLASPLGTFQYTLNYLYYDNNIIYNNKNPERSDTSTTDCWRREPRLTTEQACGGQSDSEHPLQLGDTLRLQLDTLLLERSNENFVKAIRLHYDDRYFQLDQLSLQHEAIAPGHQWRTQEVGPNSTELIFDNGHRDGLATPGNWGYAGCSEVGQCRALQLDFLVERLPLVAGSVTCPLKKVEVIYDGDYGTWEQAPTCTGRYYEFDATALGRPFLERDRTTGLPATPTEQWQIFPNPVGSELQLRGAWPQGGRFYIYDLLGRQQRTGTLHSATIPTDQLVAGTYLLSIQWQGRRYGQLFSKY
ncbi:MAG: T9SS type A sorting domain-containing protein [Bacteroidota bacterium]